MTPEELKELAKLIPAPPSGLSPIEWIAVFFAVAFVTIACIILTRMPRAIAAPIDRLSDELREERRSRDASTGRMVADVHSKLDKIADANARDHGMIRRDIARLRLAAGNDPLTGEYG